MWLGKFRTAIISQRARLFSVKTYPAHNLILMPSLSPTMEEGSIGRWLKEEGDFVKAGECLCEIETDKATVDFETVDDGFLAKVLRKGGGEERIRVGEAIGVMCEDKEDIAAFESFTLDVNVEEESVIEEVEEEKKEIQQVAPKAIEEVKGNEMRTKISPLARKTMRELGLSEQEVEGVKGSGFGQRIVLKDILNFHQSSSSSTTVNDVNALDDNNNNIDVEEVPSYFLSTSIDLTQVMQQRREMNQKMKKKSADSNELLAVKDFVLKAIAISTKQVPSLNHLFLSHSKGIREFNNIDVNVLSLSSSESEQSKTITLHNMESLSLSDISQATTQSMSTSNTSNDTPRIDFVDVGKFGVDKMFMPLQQGKTATICLGAINPNTFKATLSVSLDHRVVDGAVGAKWLQNCSSLLKDPMLMLMM